MQASPVQAARVGKGEQPRAPGHQRTGIGRESQQALPVAQCEDEIPCRSLVGLVPPGRPQQQVTRGIEIVRVRCLRRRPWVAVAVIAEPADRHRHVRPGRILDRQPVEQRGVHRDGLVTVGPDGRDRSEVPFAGPSRRQDDPLHEQDPEQRARLRDHLRVTGLVAPTGQPVAGIAEPAGPVTPLAGPQARVGGSIAAGRSSEHGGQDRACVLDRLIQVWSVQYRAISGVCHPDPPSGLARWRPAPSGPWRPPPGVLDVTDDLTVTKAGEDVTDWLDRLTASSRESLREWLHPVDETISPPRLDSQRSSPVTDSQ
jgi:hypothetical protein